MRKTVNSRFVLREKRAELGVSQNQLSQATGITPNEISKHENGHVAPNTTTVHAYALALGIDMSDLFADVESDIVQIANQ